MKISTLFLVLKAKTYSKSEKTQILFSFCIFSSLFFSKSEKKYEPEKFFSGYPKLFDSSPLVENFPLPVAKKKKESTRERRKNSENSHDSQEKAAGDLVENSVQK